MRLANGIVIDKEATFGALKFSALRREVHLQNEDGSVSEEIKERTYDLKSRGQGRMIQVSIPASVPLKEFDYNAEVELINPVADTVATATFQGAEKGRRFFQGLVFQPFQRNHHLLSQNLLPDETGLAPYPCGNHLGEISGAALKLREKAGKRLVL